MLNKKRKLFLDKNNQIKMKYKFVAEKIKRTLAYKLKKNKIDKANVRWRFLQYRENS